MSYFTGDRCIDLLRLLHISSEWGKLYNETLDIADYYGKKVEDVFSDAEGWIEWKGGECPIPDAKAGEYEIRFRCGEVNDGTQYSAILWAWGTNSEDNSWDIVAYRLVKQDHSEFANSECQSENGATTERSDATPTGCIAAGAADNSSSQIVPQPDWSTAPEWANYWAVDYSGRARWYQYEPEQWAVLWAAVGNNKNAVDRQFEYPITYWDKTLQERPPTVYPIMEGFRRRTPMSYPIMDRVRIQRRDKSFSEGYPWDFNWKENGMNTIIAWKYI